MHREEFSNEEYVYESKKNIYIVPYNNILYMMSRDKFVEIYLCDGSMRKFRGKLDAEKSKINEYFVYAGKSCIINLKHVKECYYDHIIMKNNVEISISRPYRAKFREQLKEYLL